MSNNRELSQLASLITVDDSDRSLGINTSVGIGTTNPQTTLYVVGDAYITGVITATNITGTATTATKLATPRSFEITGDVVASPIFFDGTANVSLAATIQPNSVGLGTDTTGDYVTNISGTSNQITVTGGTGESSTPTLSVPNQFTAPQDVTVTRDLQVNRNLNVNGNITIGGTSATLFTSELKIFDPDIVLGFRTDALGNDVSTDNTADHGGVAIASTEGTPLVNLFIAGIETNPATYKKIMWFKSGTFSGLGTDAWLSNYAVGIGSTQVPNGVRLASGAVQFTDRDLISIRNINASGIVTAPTLSGTTATYTTGNFTTGNIVTGVVTTISGTNLNYSGVGTITTFNSTSTTLTNINSSGISTLGVTSTTNLTAQQLNVSGVTTVGFITATNLYVSGVGTFLSSGLQIRNPANTFGYTIAGGAIVADRILNLPVITATDTVAVLGSTQTFTGTNTFAGNDNSFTQKLSASGSLQLTGTAAGISHQFGTNQTTSTLTFGGTSGTGLITFGRSTTTQQTDIQAGVSAAGTTKTINFGTGGAANSFTAINIGPTSGIGTISINAGTNLGINSTTPTSKLDVVGDGKFTGVVTATTFIGNLSGNINATGISTFTNITGTNLNYTGVSTITDIRTNTNINSSGIHTAQQFVGNINAGVGTITNITGTNLNYTGVSTITDIRTNTNINSSGINTAQQFVGNISAGVGTITNITGTNLNYTGISTVTNITGTNLNYTGVSTITDIRTNTNINSSGIHTAQQFVGNISAGVGTITNITGTNLNYTGVSTITDIRTNTNINSSGIHTAQQFVGNISAGIATISVNSSSDALRITQLGSGNALVVEDSANPDATPFVVGAAGSVGVGTITPGTKLDVSGIGRFTANGATLNLVGTDHSYIEWYPDGIAAGRKAYTGFSNSGANYFEIANEIAGGDGHIYLNPGTSAAVLIETTSATGTASQTLQVTGGAYFSGSTGVGATLPFNIGANHGTFTISGSDTSRLYFEDTGYEATGAGVGQFIYDNGNLAWFVGSRNGSTTTGSNELFRVLEGGNVGIGTTNPPSKFTVTNQDLSGTNVSSVLVDTTITDTNADVAFGQKINTIISGSTAATGNRDQGSLYLNTVSSNTGGTTTNEHRVYSIFNDVNVSGDSDFVTGIYNSVDASHSSGTISAFYGNYNLVTSTATSTISQYYGSYNIAQPSSGSTGAITTLTGIRSRANFATGAASTATNVFGVWANFDNDAGLTQSASGTAALFYGSYDVTTGYTNPYGVYITTVVDNYFAGSVGIGITNPGSLLQVVGDPAGIRITNNQGLIGDLSSSGWLISQATGISAIPPASALTISTGSVTALTALTSGSVGINTTDAGSALDVQGTIRVRDTTGNATFTAGGNLAIKDNASDPFISFHEADGTRNAFIQSIATTGFFFVQEDAFPLTIRTEQAQGIFFETNNTERMRITGVAGDVGIGTNNPGTKLHIHESNTGTTPSVRIQNSAGTIANNAVLLELFFSGDADVSGVGSAHYVRFRDNNNNPTGQISGASATTVLYATASDYRLKEDITPISNGIEQVMQFKPSEFTWKQTQTRSQGFIAHEVQEVLPEAVVGAKDAVDEEGNMIPQMIDPSKMVVVLTAALQEAIQRIQYLESVVGIGSS